MSFLQTFRIQDPESSGFRILKSSKMFYLQIFRIQDPESSGSKDPAGKSQEGRVVDDDKGFESNVRRAQMRIADMSGLL